MLTGGCHCGTVRFEAGGTPFHETICHCVHCRRGSGAPAFAWVSVRRADFAWTAGTPSSYASSPGIIRRFCGTCGTTLTFEDSRLPQELDLATATLDDPGAAPPKDHVWFSQALPWNTPGDGLPKYEHGRLS